MKNAFLKLAFDSSVDAAAIAADSAMEVVPGFTGEMLEAATNKGISIADRAREILSNKYVLSGLAVVAVTGAAYGTYRLLKKDDKVEAAPVAAVQKTPEQKVDEARHLLEAAQQELGASTAKSAKQTAVA
jgi:hypothetical protein